MLTDGSKKEQGNTSPISYYTKEEDLERKTAKGIHFALLNNEMSSITNANQVFFRGFVVNQYHTCLSSLTILYTKRLNSHGYI